MSTPPFVALPQVVEKFTFAGGSSDLAGLIARTSESPRGTVVLVPGFTGSKEDFIAVLSPLRSAGFTAVSFDNRGQFESGGPNEMASYQLSDFAADVIAVIGQLPQPTGPVHLVGHSFGGLIARQVVLELDNEVSRHIASLTLLASGPGPIPGELGEIAGRFAAMLPETPLSTLWDVKEEMDQGDNRVPASPEVHEFLRHRFVSNNPVALRAKAEILIDTPDLTNELGAVAEKADLPILVAFGSQDDRWSPAEQDEMSRRLNARRIVWPGIGHSPAAQSPTETVHSLVAFFDDVPATPRFTAEEGGYVDGMELRLPVSADPAAVSRVRQSLTKLLKAAGLESVIDDFQIVASEMVTNAIRYGSPPIEVALRLENGRVRLSVTDTNVNELPETKAPTDTEGSGRGMHLIAALATDWGVSESAKSKTVWADLAV